MLGATASRALVPGRMQSIAEMSYEFVATTLRSSAGTEGMRFFPLGVHAVHVHPGGEPDRASSPTPSR